MARDLNHVHVFVSVVQRGSFTAAGKALGVPTSTVSRRVARLEEDLGVRLLLRTTRKLSLTDAGQLYYERSVRVLAELEEAEHILSQAQVIPRGKVRLAVPTEHHLSMELINSFLAVYPQVRVEVDFSNRTVNILEEGYDASIHVGQLTNLSVVARKLLDSPFSLVASPSYLQRCGQPQSASDLSSHDCIVFGASSVHAHWVLAGKPKPLQVPIRGRLAVNHLLAARDAAVAGHGIALLPTLACGAEIQTGKLRTVLPELSPPSVPIYLTYPAGRYLPAAVRALVTFFQEHFHTAAQNLLPSLQLPTDHLSA